MHAVLTGLEPDESVAHCIRCLHRRGGEILGILYRDFLKSCEFLCKDILYCDINSSDITEWIESVTSYTACLLPRLHKFERYTSTLNHVGGDVLHIKATRYNLKQAILNIPLLDSLVELVVENIADKAVFTGQKAQFVTAQTILGTLFIEGVEQKSLLYCVTIVLKKNLHLLCLGKALEPVD